MEKPIRGPLAALLTPRLDSGAVDLQAIERNVELILEKGGTGLVLTGGTGEYFDLALEQRRAILERAAAVNAGRGVLVASIGAGTLRDVTALAEHALQTGADVLLLPPPHFYRYQQTDLEAFYRAAANAIEGPILIYNLAGFVSPIEADTIVRLVEKTPNLIGVKDSSGKLDSLEKLSQADFPSCRVLGNDKVLVEALRRNLLDAVISGPTSVIPEVTVALFEAADIGDQDRFERLGKLFDEAIDQFEGMPYPWALKTVAEVRGLFPAQLPFPPGPDREAQLRELRGWLEGWLPRLARLG
ncbi:MAG: dihydrodipicolinate synthase family protein [Bryobacterales bacterium]